MMDSRAENPKSGKQNKLSYEKGAVLLFLIVVFAVIFLAGKVKTYPDTQSYLNMAPFREPGYALLLNAFTLLFGRFGFTALGFLQNVLAVFSIYWFSCYVGSKYTDRFVMPVTAVCMVFPYVMTPLFASSGIMLTNAMISEGITLPLYHLFFLFLLKAVWEKEKQWNALSVALILSFLLLMTRGQMTVTLIAWLIVAVIVNWRGKQKKSIIMAVLLFFLVTGCRVIGINSYNLIVNGEFAGTTYGIAEEGQMLYKNAPDSFSGEAVFYSDMHDDIKDFAIFPTLQEYVQDQEEIVDYMEKSMRVDELSASLYRALFPRCFGRWFAHYVRNAAVGMIRTVAFVHPLLNIPSILGYLVLIGMGWYCYRKDRESKAAAMLLLTALLTAGNVAAVSLTIMCLSRYMIYNTAMVYVTAFLLIVEIFKIKRRQKWDIKN